jgi:hypothetical protein
LGELHGTNFCRLTAVRATEHQLKAAQILKETDTGAVAESLQNKTHKEVLLPGQQLRVTGLEGSRLASCKEVHTVVSAEGLTIISKILGAVPAILVTRAVGQKELLL